MSSYLNFTQKTEVTNITMPEGETVEIKDAKGIIQPLSGDVTGTTAASVVSRLGANVTFKGNLVASNYANAGTTVTKGELIRVKTPVIDITGNAIKDTLIWTTPPRFKLLSCVLVF